MHTIQSGYRGLRLLMLLNADRLLYAATLATALGAGAWVGSHF